MGEVKERDELGDSINDLFSSVSAMIKGELQGTNNLLELVEKMNFKVAEEYNGLGDVASGLRVFVEQLKSKSGNFDQYVQQIDAIERQVTEFEAVISMLDKHVSMLESKNDPFIDCLVTWKINRLGRPTELLWPEELKNVAEMREWLFSYVEAALLKQLTSKIKQ